MRNFIVCQILLFYASLYCQYGYLLAQKPFWSCEMFLSKTLQIISLFRVGPLAQGIKFIKVTVDGLVAHKIVFQSNVLVI